MNTLPPSDHTYFDMLNEIVQEEPSGVISKEIVGSFAAIGIVKGKEFKPDERMQKILKDAANVACATGRALNWRFTEKTAGASIRDRPGTTCSGRAATTTKRRRRP